MMGSLVALVTKARLLLRTQESSLHFHGGGGVKEKNQLTEWECLLLLVGNANLIKKKRFTLLDNLGWKFINASQML